MAQKKSAIFFWKSTEIILTVQGQAGGDDSVEGPDPGDQHPDGGGGQGRKLPQGNCRGI